MGKGILEGIRVVELGTRVAIPYCGRQLADMGAEVIKVEAPGGDAYRGKMGQLFHLPNKPKADFLYTPYNANKKSVCMNLKDPDGRDAFIKLVGTADVLLTNNREQSLERLGLSTKYLRELYPKLIVGCLNGYGTKGPRKDDPGYDSSAFWSPSGVIQEWRFTGNNQVFKPFYGYGDALTAAQVTVGVLGALYRRSITGEGDMVHVSLLHAGLWYNICGLVRYQAGQQFPKSFYEPILPLDNWYATKDGKLFLTAEEHWEQRCKAYFELFGTPELMDDPEWCTLRGYMTNIEEKAKFFEEHIAQVTSEEITAALTPAGAIFSFLDETDDVLNNEQAWATDCLTKMHTNDGTEFITSTNPAVLESQGVRTDIEPAALLGENTVSVLEEIGYSSDEVRAMIGKGAVVAYEE